MNTKDEFIKIDSINRAIELSMTDDLYFTNSGSTDGRLIMKFKCDDIYINTMNTFYEKSRDYKSFNRFLGKRAIDTRSYRQGIIIEYRLTSDGYDEYLINGDWYGNGQLLKQFIIED